MQKNASSIPKCNTRTTSVSNILFCFAKKGYGKTKQKKESIATSLSYIDFLLRMQKINIDKRAFGVDMHFLLRKKMHHRFPNVYISFYSYSHEKTEHQDSGHLQPQDHAGVGAALPDRLQYFRAAVLKQMGGNSVRTSHNMPTPEWVQACERLGLMMMCETRQ